MSRNCVIGLLFGFALFRLSAADLNQAALQHTNRLAGEKSPYLLQHAHNPVDWHPWGEEAFAKARREEKPIFLSVGYSTCHWCHVMERESFENAEIAKVLNQHFVCIKVDREERPDVDRVYMAFVQATTGGGGWPMNVWLTPDLKPFFGGTYYPPEEKFGLPAFPKVLEQISVFWAKDREKLVRQGSAFVEAMQRQATAAPAGKATLDKALLTGGYEEIAGGFDSKLGGFGRAPKFPRP
ncbi:MAG TPA: thioredoxin domain-containing protein, partial [Verrucomicrobiae bacterium]|nr:thioredoxin domain-containing protein [Verrucomicrobiae bacterium]